MFYHPEFIVFLWMLPVIGLVILPLLWSFLCTLYRSMERTKLAEVRGYVEIARRGGTRENGFDRRIAPRMGIEGGKVSVAQECKCSTAFVANASKDGLCLTNVPPKMYTAAKSFQVVFKTRERDYFVYFRPKWKKTSPEGYILGGEIVRVAADWKNFIKTHFQPRAAEAG